MRGIRSLGALTIVAASFSWSAAISAGSALTVPLSCNKGPSGQHYDVTPTIPASAAEGSTYTVRLEGTSSGKISQTGLNYVYEMSYEYIVPTGTEYVDGSAHVVAGTGTENVRAGARVSAKGSTITMVLPAHVDEGSSYTPPSFEFQLKVTGAAGTSIVQKFAQYRVTANAFLIGDVHAVCNPTPKPYTIGTTSVTAAN